MISQGVRLKHPTEFLLENVRSENSSAYKQVVVVIVAEVKFPSS